MRPKSRLIAMRILPTICEAYEEMLEDKGIQCTRCLCINSDSVGTEDYLQSICQLARPTFPTLQAISEIKYMKKINGSGLNYQLPRLPVVKHSILESSIREKNKVNITSVKSVNILPDKTEENHCCFDTDPLEQLYGLKDKMPFMRFINNVDCSKGNNCENMLLFNGMTKKKNLDKCPQSPYLERQESDSGLSKLVSFPRVSSVQSLCKINTCQEPRNNKPVVSRNSVQTMAQKNINIDLISNARLSSHQSKENLPNDKAVHCMQEKQHLTSNILSQDCRDKGIAHLPHCLPEKKNMVKSKTGAEKKASEQQATFQNWVSECKNAWKEARMKACLLPAIAEI